MYAVDLNMLSTLISSNTPTSLHTLASQHQTFPYKSISVEWLQSMIQLHCNTHTHTFMYKVSYYQMRLIHEIYTYMHYVLYLSVHTETSVVQCGPMHVRVCV